MLNNIEFSEIKSDPKLREQLRDFAEKNGGQALLSMLYEIDKEYANKLHENDVLRIIRAIEIYKHRQNNDGAAYIVQGKIRGFMIPV